MDSSYYEYTTVEEAQDAVETGIRESVEDNPDLVEDQIYGDIVEAIASFCPPDVAKELCRRELGYIPGMLKAQLGDIDFLDSEPEW